MDLDHLKSIWKEQDRLSDTDAEKEMTLMLQKKSKGPIAKMKRNLLAELVVVVVLYVAVISNFWFANGGQYWENGLLLFVIGIVFLIYYVYKNRLLSQMECLSCEVRSNLQMQVSTLEKYVRFYFLAGVIITPLAYFASGAIIFYKSVLPFHFSSPTLWIFIGFGLPLSILSYYLNKWYVNKLYGQHVAKLKELLGQLEGE